MSRRRPLTPGKALALGFQYLTLILAAVIVLLPLWSLVISSLKSAREYLDTNRIVPPQNWFNLSNYVEAIWPEQANGITIGQAFYNTGFILAFSLRAGGGDRGGEHDILRLDLRRVELPRAVDHLVDRIVEVGLLVLAGLREA